jgi:hypothetical protein
LKGRKYAVSVGFEMKKATFLVQQALHPQKCIPAKGGRFLDFTTKPGNICAASIFCLSFVLKMSFLTKMRGASLVSRISKMNSSAALRRSPFNSMSMRFLSSEAVDVTKEPREKMVYDVVTVGAGPAGLSAAIRLKQLALEKGTDISVCVIDKGAEIGAHILSGNVFETRALDELIPNWKELGAPIATEAKEDHFLVLTEEKSYEIPHALLPPQLNNSGNYIISLSQLVRWLGQQAEELGVEIYAGFSASEVLYGEDGSVRGVRTVPVLCYDVLCMCMCVLHCDVLSLDVPSLVCCAT